MGTVYKKEKRLSDESDNLFVTPAGFKPATF